MADKYWCEWPEEICERWASVENTVPESGLRKLVDKMKPPHKKTCECYYCDYHQVLVKGVEALLNREVSDSV